MNALKKWSTKKKAAAAIASFLVLTCVAGLLYYILRPDKGEAFDIVTVGRGDVTQKLETSGTVESGKQGKFVLPEGVKVVDVRVKTGQSVKAGDVLATFDPYSLNDVLAEKKASYAAADEAYEKYIANAADSKNELAKLNKEIPLLEEEIAILQKKVDAQPQDEPGSNNDTGSDSQNAVYKLVQSILGDSLTDTQLGALVERLLSSGNNSSQILQMLQGLIGNSGASYDISSMFGLSSEETQLTQKQLELLQLKAKQTMLETQSNQMLGTAYKAIADAAKKSLDDTQAAVDSIKNGWTAETNGIVREVNITAGEVYSPESGTSSAGFDVNTIISAVTSGKTDITGMLSSLLGQQKSAIIIEYYPFVAKIVLGQYDVLKVKVDQKAEISSAGGSTFQGRISYISPVATTNDSINISSLLGSSGSSSGVEAEVTIDQPDTSIIIGFNVDISIPIATVRNALLIPVESLQFDSKAAYVFILDEKSNTVRRAEVKTGIFSDAYYEILSGCKEGDKIIKAPSVLLADGDKVTPKYP